MTDLRLSPRDLPAPSLDPAELETGTSLWRDAWMRLRKNHMAIFGLAAFAFVTLACFVGAVFLRYNYSEQKNSLGASPPFATIVTATLRRSATRTTSSFTGQASAST